MYLNTVATVYKCLSEASNTIHKEKGWSSNIVPAFHLITLKTIEND